MKEALIPLWQLVQRRCQAMQLDMPALIRRCGYTNTTHGMRALERFWEGDLRDAQAQYLLKHLPTALDLPLEAVEALAAACRARLPERIDEPVTDTTRPCAWLVGSSSRPSPIAAFALTGGIDRWLRIGLDTSRSPLTFAQQALDVVRCTPTIPFFGPTRGFVVCYGLHASVRFDLDGNPVARMSHFYVPGRTMLAIGKRHFSGSPMQR